MLLFIRKAKDGSEDAVPKVQVDARNDRLPSGRLCSFNWVIMNIRAAVRVFGG